MSDLEYKLANMYVDEGRLSRRGDDKGNEVFCYTKEEFHNAKDWDFITKSHRGKLYQNGKAVNKPFPKIFNLGEVEETSLQNIQYLMDNQVFEAYDKANGHLFLVNKIKGQRELVYTLKGCITPSNQNFLLKNDIEAFKEQHEEELLSYFDKNDTFSTMMFEVIASYDKHCLYESMVEEYGIEENKVGFVWLGCYQSNDAINWHTIYRPYYTMTTPMIKNRTTRFSSVIDFDIENIEYAKEETGIEGYVIHFPYIDFRFKIKTKEYWKLRFNSNLTLERALSVFAKGGANAINVKLPEEVSTQINDVLYKHFKIWYYDFYETENVKTMASQQDLTFKEIFYNNSKISYEEALLVKDKILNRNPIHRALDSKKLRKEFSLSKNERLLCCLRKEYDEIMNSL